MFNKIKSKFELNTESKDLTELSEELLVRLIGLAVGFFLGGYCLSVGLSGLFNIENINYFGSHLLGMLFFKESLFLWALTFFI